MTHEKTFTLDTGRSVKLITKTDVKCQGGTDIEVLIKEPKEENYRLPIGKTHPKYWKLKGLDARKTRMLQMRYSGISDKQIRKAIKEFNELLIS